MASLSKRQTQRVIHLIAQELPWVAYLEDPLPRGKTAHVRDWYRHIGWLTHQRSMPHWADIVYRNGSNEVIDIRDYDEPIFSLGRCACPVCQRAERSRLKRVQRLVQ